MSSNSVAQLTYANYSPANKTRPIAQFDRRRLTTGGPWYESTGPCSPEIRNDVYNKYFKGKNNSEKRSIDIQNILIDVVPNHRKDFGSYRGYAMWRGELHNRIKIEFAKKYAQMYRCKRIRDKCIKEWVIDRLYRFPDGLRVKELKTEFYNLA